MADLPPIAVDLDDTLCQGNAVVAKWHNEVYGTDMTLDDFNYFHYWKNHGWGTAQETISKVGQYYHSSLFLNRDPIPGAVEAIGRLKAAGHHMLVLTSRSGEELKAETEAWIQRFFPRMFDSIHYSGEFTKLVPHKSDGVKPITATKAEICHTLGVRMLIDDSVDYALNCARANPPIPVLLFGDYPWARHTSGHATKEDFMSFDERVAAGVHEEWLHRDEVKELPTGVIKVRTWKDVEEHILN